jgi:hypothetical protein
MKGESCGAGAEGRGVAAGCGLASAGAAAEGGADDRGAAVCADEEATVTGAELPAGAEVTAAGAGNNFAPHIPQKRFSSEFSLPQRGQRTHPPEMYLYSLRYL